MTKLLGMINKRNALINHYENHLKTCYLPKCKHCSFTLNDIDYISRSIDLFNPLEEFLKTQNAD